MGMGEPFANFTEVMAAAAVMQDKARMNLGQRRITISTCGLVLESAVRRFEHPDQPAVSSTHQITPGAPK